ncbi:hypothetical protein GCM10011247_30000 [Pseudomonas plecoglossicida]|nr:hypothetical protein GCM10011247_30000 [Pseudomonas plecoglossicida]
MFDGSFAERAGYPQVGFLQQVLGGAGVAHHALQGTQQGKALDEEDGIEPGLTHGGTWPTKGE